MRIKLIEDLPMASSAELYQLSWVIEQLLADPRRIVQARAELHTGQQVQYLHWDDGKMRAARVVSMKDRRVTVFDEASRSHFTLPYAAIVPAQSSGVDASVPAKPTPTARDCQPHRLPRGEPSELHRSEAAAPGWPDRAHQPAHRHIGLRRSDLARCLRLAAPPR
jgi:hypothetical protein